jgi:hypothetical protein
MTYPQNIDYKRLILAHEKTPALAGALLDLYIH